MAASFTALSRREHWATHSAVLQPFHQYAGIYSFEGSVEATDTSVFPIMSLSGCLPLDDLDNSKSVVCIKSDESGVKMRYQVYEYTCTWSVEHFVA